MDEFAPRAQLPPHLDVVDFWVATVSDIQTTPDPRLEQAGWKSGTTIDPDAAMSVAQRTGLTATEVAGRFATGARWMGLAIGGETVSTGWISLEAAWVRELHVWFRPVERSAYIWDCATKPGFRGHGLYPRLLRNAIRAVVDRRVDLLWIGVEPSNSRSRAGIIRAGFRPVGAVVAYSVGPFTMRRIIPVDDTPESLIYRLCRSIVTGPTAPASDSPSPSQQSNQLGLASSQYRKWSQRPRRLGRFLATNHGPAKRPGAGAIDPHPSQAA